VNDTRLGITPHGAGTPRHVFSTGLDQSLPKLNQLPASRCNFPGAAETVFTGEQRVLTKSKTTLDAFWLYKLTRNSTCA